MLSEKLMTMMSGVITLRNMLRRKSSQPSAPSASRMAMSGGAGRDDHERHAPEEHDGDQAAGGEADGVVDQPVALDRVADLELHDRHAGKLSGQPGIGQVLADGLADLADDVAQAVALDDARIERQHDQRQLAVHRQELAADDLVRHHAIDQLSVFGAFGKLLRETALRESPRSPAAGAPRTAR